MVAIVVDIVIFYQTAWHLQEFHLLDCPIQNVPLNQGVMKTIPGVISHKSNIYGTTAE
jgi:hypothetical protein